MKINQKELYVPGNFLETLKLCRGYYKHSGAKDDPMVAYPSTYSVNSIDDSRKHFVGFEYFNCSQVEQFPVVLDAVANEFRRVWKDDVPDVILGTPVGGIIFSFALAKEFGCRHVFAEKEVIKKHDKEHLDETKLFFGRNMIRPDEKVLICDDVCQNFGTTRKMIDLVDSSKGFVSSIACLINCSSKTILELDNRTITVRSLAHVPTKRFMQGDIRIVKPFQSGSNVVWKPKGKIEWEFLMKIMDSTRK